MKRGIAILVSLSALLTVAYFTWSKWAIRHETLTFYDASRDNRPVAVDIAVRWDKEMQANAGMIKLPVAILNHGNTVKFTEYSFLANVFATRGYMAISIQHDLPTDAPMVTKVGELYVGRLPQIQRGIANIRFAASEMKNVQPNADYDHLTMVGHSMGGDISAYFAKMYPDQMKKLVTLDNLRVPFMTEGKFKILSFRSKDPVFKTDPGVLPDEEVREKAGITVVHTGFQHNDMRDTGPDAAKASIQDMLDKFLVDESPLKPVETKPSASEDISAFVAKARAMSPNTAGAKGRLVFALDATMSRQPTWDMACALQADMFREAAALGSLDIRLVYYRGFNECRATGWISDSAQLAKLMSRIDCRGGNTQIGKVLSEARREATASGVRAVVFVGDAMEERVDDLCAKAGELGLLKVPVFMFQEGHDLVAEQAFREIARLTGGAWCRFDPGAAAQLRELLRAAAAYAAGGRQALLAMSKTGSGAAKLLGQMK